MIEESLLLKTGRVPLFPTEGTLNSARHRVSKSVLNPDGHTKLGLLRHESRPRYDSDCNTPGSLPNTVGFRLALDRSESRSLRRRNRKCRMLRRPWMS